MADINLTHTGAELDEAIEKALTDFPDVDGVTAVAAHVLAGDIFVDDTGNVVGTMPNRGAVTGEASSETPYAIAEGYHNGAGIVTSAGGGAVANSIVITEVDANKRITAVDVSSFTEIYPYMFYNYNNTDGVYQYLVSVVLPVGITVIGTYAFKDCRQLIITTLPASITSIETYAFQNCVKIAMTSLPNGITIIKAYSFYVCSDLALTTLPSGLLTIENSAFYSCYKLALASLPSGLTSIGNAAFVNCYPLHFTTFPNGLLSIGYSAFQGCTSLIKLWIPASCTTITAANSATAPFLNCSSSLVFYCEASEKPAGWGAYWDNRTSTLKFTVNWGVTKEAFDAL